MIYRQFVIRPSALGRKYGFVLHNRAGQYLTRTETEAAARGLVDAWWTASAAVASVERSVVESVSYRQFQLEANANGGGYVIRSGAGQIVCTAPSKALAWCLIDQWWEQPD